MANRKDISYLIGAQWEVNDFISGDLRLGLSDNNLFNVIDGGTSTSTWNAEVEW